MSKEYEGRIQFMLTASDTTKLFVAPCALTRKRFRILRHAGPMEETIIIIHQRGDASVTTYEIYLQAEQIIYEDTAGDISILAGDYFSIIWNSTPPNTAPLTVLMEFEYA